MPLFIRRALQRVLDENARVLTQDQLAEHVRRLNSGGHRVLQTEWEVVLLHAFNCVGTVAFERPLSDGKKIDLTVNLQPPWSFVADIVTVSDAGYHEQNPYDTFLQSVIEDARRHGLTGAGLNVRVAETPRGANLHRRRTTLGLPRTKTERAEFALALDNFLEHIATHLLAPDVFRFTRGSVRVSISYNPAEPSISGGYPSYTVAYSLTNNPIYRALQDKARQLRSAIGSVPRGIIMCDGGCDSLSELHRSPRAFSLRQIMREFLRKYKHVDFVLILAVRSRSPSVLDPLQFVHVIEPMLFISEQSGARVPRSAIVTLNSVARHLPRPIRTPQNALAYSKIEHERRTHYPEGGWKVAGHDVHISARALLSLLTGNVSQDEFMKAHGFIPTRDNDRRSITNPFKSLSRGGRMLVSTRIERQPDDDDDVVVFTFGDPDPAVGPFVATKANP